MEVQEIKSPDTQERQITPRYIDASQLMSIQQYADYKDLDRSTIYKQIERGELQYVQIAGTKFIKKP